MADNAAPTHTAFALKREGKRFGRWLEIGTARIEGPDKPAHLSLDRTPIGGFNAYVYLSPVGVSRLSRNRNRSALASLPTQMSHNPFPAWLNRAACFW